MEVAELPLLTTTAASNEARRWGTVTKDLNRVSSIALPMIVVMVSQFLLRISPLFMLGHVAELSLAGASIAISVCNATGFSLLFGMSSALETLCGQANGAGQYPRVGVFTCSGILCMFLVCLPVSVLWMYAEQMLIFVGQDPLISAEAGKYATFLIPTLFPFAILQSLTRYLQTQSLIFPMLCCGLASLCLQLPLCWAMIFKMNLGSAGGALSVGISYWFNVLLLVIYVNYAKTCQKTRIAFSKEIFVSMREFFRLAIPSSVMVCMEWWAFEIVILLSGVLPNPQLETSVLSICLMMTSLHYYIPYSFGAAASTLVSNELGAGRPEAARIALYTALAISVAEFLLASITIYVCRGALGYIFSEEKEVVDYVKEMVPFLCLSIVMDSLQAVLSGVARGSGWQHIGAYVNLGSYYLVGIPLALFFGFVLQLRGKGLWTGLIAGATVQSLSLFLLTAQTNWEKQSAQARERTFARKQFKLENQSI